MAGYGILLSRNPADVEFARTICAANGMELYHAQDTRGTRKMLYPETGIFWDLDATDPPQIALGQLLLEHLNPNRIFGIGEMALNKYTNVLKMRAVGHFFRRGDPTGVEWASQLVGSSLSKETFPRAPAGAKKLSIARSKDRGLAVTAVSNVLAQKSFPPRLAQTVAQCVDELLMNAIFDAPVRSGPEGKRYRLDQNRTLDFELATNEVVILEMSSAYNALAISVTDLFGSLARGSLLSYLAKDYEHTEYRPREEKGAGLGLYGVLDSGVSLSYFVRRQKFTRATLLVPICTSIKEFRKSFQLFGVIEK